MGTYKKMDDNMLYSQVTCRKAKVAILHTTCFVHGMKTCHELHHQLSCQFKAILQVISPHVDHSTLISGDMFDTQCINGKHMGCDT